MSPEVQVADIQRDDAGARCTVRTGGRSYQASVSDSDAAALAPGASTEQLQRESFVFLLDLKPATEREVDLFLARFAAIYEMLAAWAARQTDSALDARAEGRTSRLVLLHALGTPGAYLSAALGGAPGFSRIAGAPER